MLVDSDGEDQLGEFVVEEFCDDPGSDDSATELTQMDSGLAASPSSSAVSSPQVQFILFPCFDSKVNFMPHPNDYNNHTVKYRLFY